MKYSFLILILPALMSETTCKKTKNSNESIPTCIQHKIDSIKLEPRWNPPAQVDEYSYKGKKVYLFSSDCCDQFNTLIDADCKYICAPSGGITGRGDGSCPDFNKEAKHVKLVWKDER